MAKKKKEKLGKNSIVEKQVYFTKGKKRDRVTVRGRHGKSVVAVSDHWGDEMQKTVQL